MPKSSGLPQILRPENIPRVHGGPEALPASLYIEQPALSTGRLGMNLPKTPKKVVKAPLKTPKTAAAVALHPEKSARTPKAPKASRVEIKTTRIEVKPPKTPKPPKDLYPALSVYRKGPKKRKQKNRIIKSNTIVICILAVVDHEVLKKQMFRRQSPEGEDIKKLREIIKSIKGEKINLQEFIGLIAPYTADNGRYIFLMGLF